jgi:hypothetical protein
MVAGGSLVSLVLTTSAFAVPVPVGGGAMSAGWHGEYFVSRDLTGAPAFVRKEVRIAFDWGQLLPVGGSTAEPYRSFPRENFSVRWRGRVLPRFSEAYTFKVSATGEARLWVNGQPNAGQAVALKANAPVEVKLEFRCTTRPAAVELRWASPSTPEEVIDPVAENGLNLASWAGYCFADKAKEGRWWKADTDEWGWPTSDGEFIVSEGGKSTKGTWLVQFNGKAEIETRLFQGVFVVNGKEFSGKLPRGEGYDAARNLTTAKLLVEQGEGAMWVKFTRTSRDGSDSTGTGLTNVRFMRPTAFGADTPHNPGELGYRPMKQMAECFTCLRWLEIANVRSSGKWADRSLPGYIHFRQRRAKETEGGENWEQFVMLANETGRDLYICAPIAADNEYFEKLARLLKFGSDGREPYPQPVANPVYPPLNPNLRAYIEVGNEIWNWAFGSTQQCRESAEREIKEQTAEAKIFNYDNKGNYRTWHALRTVRCSDIFRSVFGDAGMGARVRMLCEYQYANAQDTAWQSFRFLDAYFNNGDGDHVKEPHPANYYLWGGGGAAYYGVGNPDGVQTNTVFRDGSFEQIVIADGTLRSTVAGSPWQFQGDAGLFRNLTSALAGYEVDTKFTARKNAAIGFKFRVGNQPLFAYRLGRVFTRNSEGARMCVVRDDTKQIVMQATTAKAGGFLTKMFGYYFTPTADKPVRLEPNTVYCVLANDEGGDEATATAGAGITLLGAVRATVADADKPATWKFTDTTPGRVLGPVTLLYSTRPDVQTTFPQPPDGQQAAFIRGMGEFSQVVNFTKPGDYSLTFNATGDGKGWPGHAPFQVLVDDQDANAQAQHDYRGGAKTCNIGGWGRQNGFKEEWGSAVFRVAKSGPHTIRFVGAGKETNRFTVFDNLRIASVDAIMESGFGAGSALGQPAEAKWSERQMTDSQFVLAFGLPRVSYETGWSLGGDFYQKPIHNYAKFKDTRGEKINDKAAEWLERSGCTLPVWGVYIYWPPDDFTHGREYPIMKNIIASSNRLAAEPDDGIKVPGKLTAAEAIRWHGAPKSELSTRGDWLSWIIICPATGDYEFKISATGNHALEADGKLITGKVHLTKGAHGLRLRNTGATVSFNSIEVTKP